MKETKAYLVLGFTLVVSVVLYTGFTIDDFNVRERAAARQADALIKQMTLEEKILQLLSYNPNGVPRLGIPNLSAGETLHGVVSGGCTSFPQSISLGATFDPELVREIGSVIAKEARAVGIAQSFSPMLGIARDARWGRVEESYGEDPLLVTRIGVAYIKGMQGEGNEMFGKDKVFTTPKHMLADGEPLAGMNGEGAEFSDRLLREVYMPPFEAAVREALTRSVMPAHHAINGIPCHVNSWLLQTLLRDEWKFNGFITSDMDDVPKTANGGGFGGYKLYPDTLSACFASLKAGEKKQLTFKLGYEQIKFWKNNTWTAEPGVIQLMIGSSSDDIRLLATTLYTI